jgi:lipopolysaccharide/colanic/teichoic acid biosynthesis glycosyltransferase
MKTQTASKRISSDRRHRAVLSAPSLVIPLTARGWEEPSEPGRQILYATVDGTAILSPPATISRAIMTFPASRRLPRHVSAPSAALKLFPMPAWKRATDIVGAASLLLLLLPLMVLVALAVKVSSRGPAIFRQRRCGFGGKPFVMFKFRTMVCDAEALKPALLAANEQSGPAFKMRHDPRITRLGRFLRQTSLDEMPQLWNVLRGDMSLVGPRPLPCNEAAACQPHQRRRLSVTPGITGLWQVRGRCGVPFDHWLALDLEYIAKRSLSTDLRILLLTVPAVLSRKGAW